MANPSSASHALARREARPKQYTDESRERLRAAVRANRPWEKTRGPVTAEGKARSARNGRFRQRAELSRRELRAELACIFDLIRQMDTTRRSLA